MATLPPGTGVSIRADALRRLAFPPPEGSTLLVAVHDAALRASNPHTQLIGVRWGDVVWAGALSERSLEIESEEGGDPRQLLGDIMGSGPRLWDLLWPGDLVTDPERGPVATVYQGERPWLVIGTVADGDLLAAPLNDAANPKWFTPLLARHEVRMPGSSKDAQLELAHLWSFPPSLGGVGSLALEARERVLAAVRSYF